MNENPFAEFTPRPSQAAANPFSEYRSERTPSAPPPMAEPPLQRSWSPARPLGTTGQSFAQGVLGGAAGLVGGAMEMMPGPVGRAGAAVSRFGQEQQRQAQERDYLSGLTGGLSPYMLPVGRALEAPTLAGRVLRGAGVGGILGAATPTGQEAGEERIGPKVTGAAIGAGLGAAVPAVGGAVGGAYRALTGGRSARQLEELAQSVRSGSLERELLSVPSERLQANLGRLQRDIEALERSGQISAQQARSAITSMRQGAAQRIAPQRAEVSRAETELRAAANERASAPDSAQIGDTMLNRVFSRFRQGRQERSNIAETLYSDAHAAADAAQASGDAWQRSASGQDFLRYLRGLAGNERSYTEGQRQAFRRILEGVEEGRPQGTGVFGPDGRERMLPGVTPDSRRITTVLRELREAQRPGAPDTGFAAIGTDLRRDLARRLGESLGEWRPEFRQADATYRALSDAMHMFETSRGARVTRGERFDFSQAGIDPQQLPGIFFRSPQGVRQLTQMLGGDVATVNQLARDYALGQLRNMDAAAARAWMQRDTVRTWLNDSGPLRPAYMQVQQNIDRAERGQQALERAQQAIATERGEAVRAMREQRTRTAEARRGTETQVAEARGAQQAERQAFEAMREPLSRLSENVRLGVVRPDQVPAQMRRLLGSEAMRNVPEAAKREIVARIEAIERIQNTEQRNRAILRTLGIAAAGGVAVHQAERLGGIFGLGGR